MKPEIDTELLLSYIHILEERIRKLEEITKHLRPS